MWMHMKLLIPWASGPSLSVFSTQTGSNSPGSQAEVFHIPYNLICFSVVMNTDLWITGWKYKQILGMGTDRNHVIRTENPGSLSKTLEDLDFSFCMFAGPISQNWLQSIEDPVSGFRHAVELHMNYPPPVRSSGGRKWQRWPARWIFKSLPRR